jgi:VWFA-related protein
MRPSVCLAVAVFVMASGVVAQETDQPQATFFAPVDVPLVSVDVYVFDSGGQPTPGLTIDDFEIFEDGRRVEISHFYASSGMVSGAWDTRESPETGLEATSAGQDLYLVVFFDDTNLDRGRRQVAIEHLRSFLSAELPIDLQVMLVRYDGRNIVEQPFTEETDEALAALDEMGHAASISRRMDENALMREMETAASLASMSGRMAETMLENSARTLWGSIESYVEQTVHRTRTSIENQKRLISSLSGLSGRKAIFLVTDGVEARPGEALYRTWGQVFGTVPTLRSDAQRAFMQASQNDLSKEFDGLARVANGHRVSFYTLSTLGEGQARAVSAETRLMDSDGVAIDQGVGTEVLVAHIAAATGGRSLVNSPALAGQLDEVSEELSSYYSLAFEPQHLGDGEYHRLNVEVNRKGLRVRHREGYMDVPLEERMNNRTLAAAIHGVADNPLGVTVASSGDIIQREDGTYLVPVVVTVPIEQLVLIPAETEHQGRISIHLRVRDWRGDLSAPIRREYTVAIPNASLIAALGQGAGFTMRLVVRSGRQRIAVGLRDEVSRAESVTWIEVEVGDTGGREG